MTASKQEKRLKAIREGLERGDKQRIARLAEVSWVWVSYVIAGKGTSERILQIAEALIRERKQRKQRR